jgi:ribosome-binding factor A
MARDIKTAVVYYSVSGSEGAREDAARGFAEARGYIKRILAGKLGLRYMPEIKFFYDESIEYGTRIDNLIRSIHSDEGNGTGNIPAEEE